MQIAIVGGSLAGLFAATLLAGDGHKIAIYERSLHGLEGRGAGLLGKRDTFAVLRAAGCEHVARVGVVARERIVFDRVESTVVSEMPPQMQIPWDYLYRTFRNRVSKSYVLGRRVDSVRQDGDQVVVVFDDGGVEMADLAIGADGIASVVRASVDGSRGTNTYAGYVGWRGLLPERSLPAAAAAKLLERFAYFRMPRSHVIGFLVPGPRGETEVGARRYNWVWYRPAPGPVERDTALTDSDGHVHPYSLPPGAVSDRSRAALTEDAERLLPRPFADAIKATDRPLVQGIFDYETENMVSGRIALAGDAAFVVRPHAGMGIAKAAGDAMSLRKHLLSKPAVEALQSYRNERAPLGAAIAASGRELGAQLS
ncbi:FAD-dependent monooxygenase [Bradyrhizobium erythrophlei]|uniref:2-polyprenyl-6-methoxyphenol hydroxylase n=1 Tax=Bradyrhizobium erythrophlei TaxID=1437360 RepID=A0A1M7U4L2_9BRAD|nr:FAD-dependent monooxygenase [Bradyrhizobium erythrophlei]SHN77820.1 2-polyprenyl-6-methoxyphenol hydroxylase [Bradyrhizobium erythrophlei]